MTSHLLVKIHLIADDICDGLCVCSGAGPAAVDVLRHLSELVCHPIGHIRSEEEETVYHSVNSVV